MIIQAAGLPELITPLLPPHPDHPTAAPELLQGAPEVQAVPVVVVRYQDQPETKSIVIIFRER